MHQLDSGVASIEGRDILLVEDDDPLREALAHALRRRGWRVREAATLLQAVKEACLTPVQSAVVDLMLPDGSGMDVLRALRLLQSTVQVLLLTGHGTDDTGAEAAQHGAVGVLRKPASVDEVLRKLGLPTAHHAARPH